MGLDLLSEVRMYCVRVLTLVCQAGMRVLNTHSVTVASQGHCTNPASQTDSCGVMIGGQPDHLPFQSLPRLLSLTLAFGFSGSGQQVTVLLKCVPGRTFARFDEASRGTVFLFRCKGQWSWTTVFVVCVQ